jgi:hypothetical protein
MQKFDHILSLYKIFFLTVIFLRGTHVCQIAATAFAYISLCYETELGDAATAKVWNDEN